MRSRDFAALVNWPYAKLMRTVATIPGAVKMKDAQGRPYWEIPESAAAAPPFQVNPAEASPAEVTPPDPPGDPNPNPEPETPPPPPPGKRIPGLIFVIIPLILMYLGMRNPRVRPLTPPESPLYY
jgi:hypothetical protein